MLDSTRAVSRMDLEFSMDLRQYLQRRVGTWTSRRIRSHDLEEYRFSIRRNVEIGATLEDVAHDLSR